MQAYRVTLVDSGAITEQERVPTHILIEADDVDVVCDDNDKGTNAWFNFYKVDGSSNGDTVTVAAIPFVNVLYIVSGR